VQGGSGSTASGANNNQWVANQTLEDYALRFTARARDGGPPPASPTPPSAQSRSWRWKRSAHHPR